MTVEAFPTTIEACRSILSYSRDSAERLLGVFGQDQEIADWAEGQGMEIVGHARDKRIYSLSQINERPALTAAVEAIEAHQADGLAVHRLDRLARNFEIQSEVLHRIWDAGGRVFSVDPPREWKPDQRGDQDWMLRKAYAERAEAEHLALLGRLQAGRRRHMANGGYGGGNRYRRPYGRKLVVRGGKHVYVPVPEEQKVIRMICDWMRIDPAPEGIPQTCVPMKYAQIARDLDDMGIPTVDGGPWNRKVVRDLVLRGPDRLRVERAPKITQPLEWVRPNRATAG